MSDLSETLGHILCEITRARMAADLEAVKIAKQYAADPDGLLRSFPVPRMRMPNVEMSLPVVVSQIPEGYLAEVPPDMLATSLSENLKEILKGQSIHVSTAELAKIIRADANLSRGLVSRDLATKLSQELSDHVRVLGKAVKRATPEAANGAARFEAIRKAIQSQVDRTVDSLPQRAVGIAVDARTQQVKEIGPGAFCMNLKLSVQEESLDMVFEEPQEGQAERPALKQLVPE